MKRKFIDGWTWPDLQDLSEVIAEQAGALVLDEIVDSTSISLFSSRLDDNDFSIRAHSEVEWLEQVDGKELVVTCLCETGFRKLITEFLGSEDREDIEPFAEELRWALGAVSDRLKEQT